MTKKITVKNIVHEVFQDYKKPSMFIAMCSCDWKCAFEGGFDKSVCQNSTIAKEKHATLEINKLCETYIRNTMTSAIIFGGLEPFLQFDEMLNLIDALRQNYKCNDDIVIYTGYYKDEIKNYISQLSQYPNIIVKFGRYVPNQKGRVDNVLGIKLASDNQYAEKIS